MPPVFWEFHDRTRIVKFVGTYTSEQLFQAFSEAVESAEYRTCARLLIDSRSSILYATPDVVRERVQFIFDSVKTQVVRCAVVSTPYSMVSLVESAAEQYTALGMEARAFTDILDAFVWVEAPED